MTKQKNKEAVKAPKQPGKSKNVALGLLWLYGAVLFATTAILVFKAYNHYATTFIALQQGAIAVAIIVYRFTK